MNTTSHQCWDFCSPSVLASSFPSCPSYLAVLLLSLSSILLFLLLSMPYLSFFLLPSPFSSLSPFLYTLLLSSFASPHYAKYGCLRDPTYLGLLRVGISCMYHYANLFLEFYLNTWQRDKSSTKGCSNLTVASTLIKERDLYYYLTTHKVYLSHNSYQVRELKIMIKD